jgi:cell division septation protein DedD
MARSPAAVNGGWPPARHPAEPDPRARAPQGQRPAQPGYPQEGGYPDPNAQNHGYDPQSGYHYPQGGQPAQPGPRQGLSSLEPAGQHAPDYPPYQTPYGQPQQLHGYGQPQSDPNGQNGFRPAPYGAPGRQPDPMSDPRGAPSYEQWQLGSPQQDPRGGYDLGNYMPTGAPGPAGMPHHDPMQPQHEWGGALGYAEGAPRDAYAGQMGYEPTHGGALEQSYAQEEAADYDVDEPRRGSWALRIAGAIVVAIGLGYGLAQGYKLVADTSPTGAPPVVHSDSAPAKITPAEPGGKQFAHADSKIMGRLGEGSPGAQESSEPDMDSNGARKVQTLVIGRDGSVNSPPAADEPVTTGAVAVPGVTVVDGFGGGFPSSGQSAAAPASEAPSQPPPSAARKPVVVRPPPSETKPVVEAKAEPPETSEPAASPSPAPTKTAAVAPTASTGSNGYVVVLASVPASGESRLSALRKFADMQQKYGAVLQNKTPDVQEANLGAKGTYHRLLVGPPSSRGQASTLCSDLKAAGYKDCWVMAY